MELPINVTQAEPLKRMRIAILISNIEDRNFDSALEAKLESNVKQITEFDNSSKYFAELITQVAAQLEPKSVITIQYQSQKLYFLNDVYCAQLQIHPHAYLSGCSVADSLPVAEQQALVQAKRRSAQVLAHTQELNAETSELDCFVDSIKRIASRTQVCSNGSENYWFMPQHQPRILQLNLVKPDLATSLILVQGSGVLPAKPLVHDQQLFFVISANSINEIIDETQLLVKDISSLSTKRASKGILQKYFAFYQKNHQLALVLQATSLTQLQLEIQQFLTTAESKKEQAKWHWHTPSGSCFHFGYDHQQSGLTFVYPGVGTTYKNMLSSLHLYFPSLYQELEKKLDLNALLQASCFYSDTPDKPSLSQLAIGGVGTSYLLSHLLLNEFKLKPELALGYSMGEAAMWASLGVWQRPESLIEKTASSDIFNIEISGELKSVKRLWQLKDDESIKWNSFVVRCPAEKIEALLAEYPKAYLAITQGDTCVLAGDEHQCQQLLKHLGKRGIASNMVTAMHTPAASGVYDALKQFYQLLLKLNQPEISFICAGRKQVIKRPNSQVIAQSIAHTFTEQLNFSSVIETAINNGSRIFVEVGADRQTASIIDKLTKQNDDIHSLAINSKAQPTITSLLKCIAQLISLRVPLSLEPLMSCDTQKELKGSPSVNE